MMVVGGLVAAVVAVLVPLVLLLEDGQRAEITFVNESDWSISVELVLDDGASRLPIGTIGRHRTEKVYEIPSPGDVWTFRWWFGDDEIETRVSDRVFRSMEYRLAVPRALLDRLRAAGTPPSPY